jgi:hypothetical protein
MTDLLANFNVRWALAQVPALGDLPPGISHTSVALSIMLLAAQILSQVITLGLTGVKILSLFLAVIQRCTSHLDPPL